MILLVSSDDIKKGLADRRAGKHRIKRNLNEDWTPSSDAIKEKLRQKRKIRNETRGYLFCENCKGYYELQPGESAGDFESCQCGGELKHRKTLNITKDEG